MLLIGLSVIVLGGFLLAARDASWSLTRWSNRAEGIQSERTPEWELTNVVTGIALVLLGLLALGLGLFAGAQKPAASSEVTITVSDPATGESYTKTLSEEEYRRYQKDPSALMTITAAEMRQRRKGH